MVVGGGGEKKSIKNAGKNFDDNNLRHSLVFQVFQSKRSRKWPLDGANMNQQWSIKLVQMTCKD